MQTNQIVFPAPITAQLELLGDMLIHAEVNLQDLPAPLAAFYHLGTADGRTQLEPQLRTLEHECDRLYLQLAHPKQRAAKLQARLEQHFAAEADRSTTEIQHRAHAA